jgi:hypothetical protein
MGCTESYELPAHFSMFSTWPSQRVSSMLKAYVDGEYDYGIDHTVVMSLTGLNLQEAKVLVKALSKGDTSVINAACFLLSVIMLGEANRRSENSHLALCFEVFDFSLSGQLSFDEFSIMLLCLVTTQGMMIGRNMEIPSDKHMILVAETLYGAIGKNKSNPIELHEVNSLYNEYFKSHKVTALDEVFDRLLLGDKVTYWPAEEE